MKTVSSASKYVAKIIVGMVIPFKVPTRFIALYVYDEDKRHTLEKSFDERNEKSGEGEFHFPTLALSKVGTGSCSG